jgi:hypothetical protein
VFLGCHAPNFIQSSTRPPKGTSYVRTRALIHQPWKSVRWFRACAWTWENNKNRKGQQRYISRVRGGGTPLGRLMKLGTFVDVPDVINHANFHLRVMSSLWACWGSKRGFCLWNAYGSYNITLRFRAGKGLCYPMLLIHLDPSTRCSQTSHPTFCNIARAKELHEQTDVLTLTVTVQRNSLLWYEKPAFLRYWHSLTNGIMKVVTFGLDWSNHNPVSRTCPRRIL